MVGRFGSRPLAFLLHSLFGLKLSLFTLFVCATGTLAVVGDELEWLFLPEVRASAAAAPASWGRQYGAVRAAFPDHTVDFATAGEEPYLATRFLATNRSGELRVVYVDPAIGEVTGETGWITPRSFLRALHYLLFMPGDWGFFAVTALGFVLAVSLATGLLVYKKFWRGFFRRPRTGSGARIFWGDLHRLVGLWSVWFVFVMAVTSLWYMGERILYRVDIELEAAPGRIAGSALDRLGPATPEWLRLDDLVAGARARLPGLVVREIGFPAQPEAPLSIRGQAAAWLVRDRANGVDLNPYTGDVLSVRRVEAMTPLQRWVHTADPLHFGDFGGLASKIVWVVFGLAMCLSVASGAVIHARRTVQAIRPGLAILGRWRWPNLAAVSVVPVLAFLLSWRPDVVPDGAADAAFASAPIGPWSVTVSRSGGDDGWRVRFCPGCFGQMRAAWLACGTAGRGKVRLAGSANALSAREPAHPHRAGSAPLSIIAEGWDGRIHTARPEGAACGGTLPREIRY